eukprot:CAMPEP_0115860160 /NCGR_PEP_ID=MMETSP0287-20121206/16982_1 /TAXON_ID=412157 /ORGANISM="Chrysochromulina rotalis, Strain UIO044" /LENGTH=39 /DNA_ID= /DNA_START= /DNA_END= /DNA_ORIENTATION=
MRLRAGEGDKCPHLRQGVAGDKGVKLFASVREDIVAAGC